MMYIPGSQAGYSGRDKTDKGAILAEGGNNANRPKVKSKNTMKLY